MGLRADAEAMTGHSGTRSIISKLVASLDGDERDELVALIWDDHHISCRAAAAAIRQHYPNCGVTDQQVMDHRKKPRP